MIEKVTDLDYKIKQVNKRGKSLVAHVNRLKTFYSYKPIKPEHPVKNEQINSNGSRLTLSGASYTGCVTVTPLKQQNILNNW